VKKLSISESRQLPEFGAYDQLLNELSRELQPATMQEAAALKKYVMDLWRLDRSFRFELKETEAHGMVAFGMPNLLRRQQLGRSPMSAIQRASRKNPLPPPRRTRQHRR